MTESINHTEQIANEELMERLLTPQPTVIGIEGGPCGGKTTLVERLAQVDSPRPIVVLPEAASQHIAKLAARWLTVPELAANDRAGFLAFEADVLHTIVAQVEQAKANYADTDAIIVADRVDIGAYVSSAEYSQILDMIGLSRPPMLDLVDQLYYLPSVAIEDPARYDQLQASNAARYEDLAQAQATCAANLAAVARHPELHVAWGGDFTDKVNYLLGEIVEPDNETELALEYIDANGAMSDIRSAYRTGRFLSRSRITQSYHRLAGQEFRLRQTTTEQAETIYSFTVKNGQGLRRHEVQRQLSATEFEQLSRSPQIGRTLSKQRYEFMRPHELANRGYRKWTTDYYDAPDLQRWQAEVELRGTSEDELFPWSIYDKGNRVVRPAQQRARDLAEA